MLEGDWLCSLYNNINEKLQTIYPQSDEEAISTRWKTIYLFLPDKNVVSIIQNFAFEIELQEYLVAPRRYWFPANSRNLRDAIRFSNAHRIMCPGHCYRIVARELIIYDIRFKSDKIVLEAAGFISSNGFHECVLSPDWRTMHVDGVRYEEICSKPAPLLLRDEFIAQVESFWSRMKKDITSNDKEMVKDFMMECTIEDFHTSKWSWNFESFIPDFSEAKRKLLNPKVQRLSNEYQKKKSD